MRLRESCIAPFKSAVGVYYQFRKEIMISGRKILTLMSGYFLTVFFATCLSVFAVVKMIWFGKTYFRVTPRDIPPACLSDPKWGTHNYISLKDIKIHYVETGDRNKPLLLLVHGFPEFWYCWRYQLQEFARDYWVVAIDLRGYGDSDKPPGLKNYTLSVLVNDLKEIIIRLGKTSCIVAAHDWGGLLAWYLTIQYPNMVDKLIILNSPHPKAFTRHIHNSFKQLFMSSYIFWFQVPYLGEVILRSKDIEIFDKLIYGQIYDKNSFTNEDIEAYKYTFSKPGAFTPPINYYRNIFSNKNPKEIYQKITIPVMIIWGMKDTALDPKLAELSAEYVENCTVKLIPNVSHWVQQDAHQLVNDYIREFLNVPDSLSRGLVKKVQKMRKHLASSVSGIMRWGGMIREENKLLRTGNFLASAVGKRLVSSSVNLICDMSGVPVEALHGLVMLN